MSNERTIVNLRGYCFYCLKKISNDSCSQSPSCTPVPASPLSTPLRIRCHNVHSLPPEQRIAPFTDLCRYLGVDLPDSYAFGDGLDAEVLYPPLCDKCHDLSARLCVLQDELQYIQGKIQSTVERIHRRVASTCDKRGVLKREEFNQEFRRKSKGSLSRGRGEKDLEKGKVTDLLKAFQSKIIGKDHENQERRKRRATKVLFPEYRASLGPPLMQPAFMVSPMVRNDDDDECNDRIIPHISSIKKENEENVEQLFEEDDELLLSRNEFLPPEETLRSARFQNASDDVDGHELFEAEFVSTRRVNQMSDLNSSALIQSSSTLHNTVECCFDYSHKYADKIDGKIKNTRVTTRTKTKIKPNPQDDLVIRRRTRKVVK